MYKSDCIIQNVFDSHRNETHKYISMEHKIVTLEITIKSNYETVETFDGNKKHYFQYNDWVNDVTNVFKSILTVDLLEHFTGILKIPDYIDIFYGKNKVVDNFTIPLDNGGQQFVMQLKNRIDHFSPRGVYKFVYYNNMQTYKTVRYILEYVVS